MKQLKVIVRQRQPWRVQQHEGRVPEANSDPATRMNGMKRVDNMYLCVCV
jgi:hypothetical protein